MLRILYLPHSGLSLRKNEEGYCDNGMFGAHRLGDIFQRSQTITLEEYWRLVVETSTLSNEALRWIPDTLSPNTKKRLFRKKPEETAEIVLWAINQIDHGSVETMNALVNQKM